MNRDSYEVHITNQAAEHLKNIVSYISQTLLEPELAQRWAMQLRAQIEKLCYMPARYPLADEQPWHLKSVRKMVFRNFLIYYVIDEWEKQVAVIAILYGRRDQLPALLHLPLGD